MIENERSAVDGCVWDAEVRGKRVRERERELLH